MSFDMSEYGGDEVTKDKKVGYYKAKIQNLMKTGIFNQTKKNVRKV